jgi:hypothetical protein
MSTWCLACAPGVRRATSVTLQFHFVAVIEHAVDRAGFQRLSAYGIASRPGDYFRIAPLAATFAPAPGAGVARHVVGMGMTGEQVYVAHFETQRLDRRPNDRHRSSSRC